MKLRRDYAGYLVVGLMKNRVEKVKRVHRLVAQAFIPNPAKLPEVNHRNGQKDDNSIANLEWSSRRSQMQHAAKQGLLRRWKGKKITRLDFCTVIKIREKSLQGAKIPELMKKYKLSRISISRILSKNTWEYVPGAEVAIGGKIIHHPIKTH